MGNVLVTISDKRLPVLNSNGTLSYYDAEVVTANDYYPFGMQMPGRIYTSSSSSYRYGFNGKENDIEVKGEGNQQDYGMRIYDVRTGRFLSNDPLTKSYPHYTPYSYAGNKPIKFIDLDGLEEAKHWFDYDINDLMNWISKPSNPIADDGFVHKATTAFNRNFNPILPATVLLTGNDYSSSDYPRMTRSEAGVILVTQAVLHKSLTIAVKPTAAAQLEMQMSKNAVAMGKVEETAAQQAAADATNTEVLGRVQSRINVANGRTRFTPLRKSGEPVSAGFEHVLGQHFNRPNEGSRSIFTITPDELKSVLNSKQVIQSPVTAIEGGQYVRTVDIGRTIGKVGESRGGGDTNFLQVISDEAGNLITTFPVKR